MSKATDFQLPRKLDRYIAALAQAYAGKGERQLQELLVNAQSHVKEDWEVDSWGGSHGHALYLVVPETLFLQVLEKKDDVQRRLQNDLNNLHNVQSEHVAAVFVELEDVEDKEWRQKSGLLLSGIRSVAPTASKRIWGDGDDKYRLFLSHKTEVKKKVADLKHDLAFYGISGFVAHEDIHPTMEWQSEIENALASMDGFAALLTERFHESDWTDQEVGYAIARNVPHVAIRLGRDPYGFIGKFQALSCGWDNAAFCIASLLIKHERMLNSYINVLVGCTSFDSGNKLGMLLEKIERLGEEQIDRMILAYNENSQLRGSYAFNGAQPSFYGDGLLPILNKFSERKFKVGNELKIKPVQRKVIRKVV